MGEKDHSDKQLAGDGGLSYVPLASIAAIARASADPIARASCSPTSAALNTLYMIMQAGSGHIGSSFSSTDLITWLWTEELVDANSGAPGADTYFSSKGHDAPALYSLLIALGKLDFESDPPAAAPRRPARPSGRRDDAVHRDQHRIARHGDLEGLRHGARAALHRPRRPHRGDDRRRRAAGRADLGIAAAVRQRAAVGDHRRRRSQQAAVGLGRRRGQRSRADRGQVPRVRLGGAPRRRPRLRRHSRRVRAFRDRRRSAEGAHRRHDQRQRRVVHGRPRLRRPDVSLPRRRAVAEGLPRRRRRADDRGSTRGCRGSASRRCALRERAAAGPRRARQTGTPGAGLRRRAAPDGAARAPRSSSSTPICCRTAASKRSRTELPERFIECGIAEQHMVSAAGGMALNGMLPVVHSFACFLSTRANEHIYNNATERTKDHLHGDARRRRARRTRALAPIGPRHLGDRLGARADRDRAVQRARSAARHPLGGRSRTPASTYLRFVNVPLDLPYTLPASYALQVGRGVTLREGADVALVGYGPLLMTNAWRAADELAAQGVQRGGHQPAVAQSHRRGVGRRDARPLPGRRHARQPLRGARPGRDGGGGAGAHRRRAPSVRSIGLTDVPRAAATPKCSRTTASMPVIARVVELSLAGSVRHARR